MADRMLELGGGPRPAANHVNLDPVHGVDVWQRYAQEVPWPCDDGHFAEVRAHHMLEHVPAGLDRIVVFNEAWRVLQPGGRFRITVPRFPLWQAIADPTHVSFFVRESFLYFTERRTPADYGIILWELESLEEPGNEIRCVLRKGTG